jgi:putative ABC transport system permease protein
MTNLLRDVRFALRLLRRNPGFAAVATLTLALGIGATTAIFSVVYGLFFAPLPYRQADRLVMVWEQTNGERRGPSPRSYVEWKEHTTAFSDINAWGGGLVNLATDDRPLSVSAGLATPGFLSMLGYGHPLALGRTFLEEEGVPGRDKVVVLTYRLWQDSFGGDRGIVGKTVRIDDVPHTVVGVLGEGPADHQQNKVWMPLAFGEEQLRNEGAWLNVMGRLKDDVELPEANARMKALTAELDQARATPRAPRTVSVEPFRNNFVADSTKRGVWLLLGAVGFLLLIACANVANLLLARGAARQRELAIRTAIGASRRDLARQVVVETMVVGLIGGVLGALLALGVIDAVVALMPAYTLPSETEIALSLPVLFFGFVVCTLAGLLAGLAPARRTSRADVVEAIKEGGRSVSVGRDGLWRALVAVEFALALTLLAGGGMAARALMRTMNVDPGFRAERLVTMNVQVARGRFTSAEQAESFYRTLREQVAALPGVASASVSTGMPVDGSQFGTGFEVEGRPSPEPLFARINMVSPEYYATFGIPVTAGRAIEDHDRAGTTRVVVVNQAFARRFLEGASPVGQHVRFRPFTFTGGDRPGPESWEIVGVRPDVANNGLGRETRPELDIPFAQIPWPRARIAVRTTGAAADIVASVGDVVHRLDPTIPLAGIRTIEETMAQATAPDRFYTVFLVAFAGVALTLAVVGIYGLMSFTVAQRTHEIGLRMALGADRMRVLGHVLREGMLTALLGTALGGVGALSIGRALEGTIYGVERTEPWTFAAVAALLIGSAVLACLLPARRAATVDPMVALRGE